MVKGYIAIMTYGKSEYACEVSEPHNTMSGAVHYAGQMKDDKWDLESRNKFGFYVLNIANGKKVKLKGWKTRYSDALQSKVYDIVKEKIGTCCPVDKKECDIMDKIERQYGLENTDTYWVVPKKL